MSFTMVVPAGVPSLFHSSTPCVPSSAWKNASPPSHRHLRGNELAPPGLMSLTILVPAAVPSVFHSSTAMGGIDRVEQHQAARELDERVGIRAAPRPGLMSLTSVGPLLADAVTTEPNVATSAPDRTTADSRGARMVPSPCRSLSQKYPPLRQVAQPAGVTAITEGVGRPRQARVQAGREDAMTGRCRGWVM